MNWIRVALLSASCAAVLGAQQGADQRSPDLQPQHNDQNLPPASAKTPDGKPTADARRDDAQQATQGRHHGKKKTVRQAHGTPTADKPDSPK